MSREDIFLNLKKVSNLALVILMLLTVIERIIYLPQD